MRKFILIIIFIPILGFSQVKEINFLGKNWYLHGYDFRLKSKFYSEDFFENLVDNVNFPNANYKNAYIDSFLYAPSDVVRSLNTVSAGFVFRPFHVSQLKFIRQVELAHNLELHYMNEDLYYRSQPINSVNVRSFQLGYNPRVMASTPTFAEYLKLYFVGDAHIYLPIHSLIYTQVSESFLSNPGSQYVKNNVQYNDRLNVSQMNTGLGYGIGIKMNVSCSLNFHLEANRDYIFSHHWTTRKTSVSNRIGVQVGVRHKFGTRSEEDDNDGIKPSGFW